jgi:hypothetical protein
MAVARPATNSTAGSQVVAFDCRPSPSREDKLVSMRSHADWNLREEETRGAALSGAASSCLAQLIW